MAMIITMKFELEESAEFDRTDLENEMASAMAGFDEFEEIGVMATVTNVATE